MTNNSYLGLTKGRVGMNVKAEYARQTNCLVTNVSFDTIIRPQEIEPLLEGLSTIYRRRFTLKRGKPRRGGWKISTIIGHLYNHQDEFSPLE